MSKMRMPEMSVVRFTESDVIVASVASVVRLVNWGDGKAYNGVIKVGDEIIYNHTTSAPAIDTITSYLPTSSPSFHRNDSDSAPFDLSALITVDNHDGDTSDIDGVYYWNSGNDFVRRQ
ncbi:MAG: hypothetical protein IKO15_01765 [Clostridiales bacterium]|nr:hypothetical protein [Clostridiales bacterium]